jgi:hypothetical protein
MTFVRLGCGTCELTGAPRLRVRFGLVERLCATKEAAPTLGVAGIPPTLGEAGCWALTRGRAINAIPKQKKIVRSLSVIIVITHIITYLVNNKPVSVSIFLPLRLKKIVSHHFALNGMYCFVQGLDGIGARRKLRLAARHFYGCAGFIILGPAKTIGI